MAVLDHTMAGPVAQRGLRGSRMFDDYARAQTLLRQCLSIFRQLGDDHCAAACIYALAAVTAAREPRSRAGWSRHANPHTSRVSSCGY